MTTFACQFGRRIVANKLPTQSKDRCLHVRTPTLARVHGANMVSTIPFLLQFVVIHDSVLRRDNFGDGICEIRPNARAEMALNDSHLRVSSHLQEDPRKKQEWFRRALIQEYQMDRLLNYHVLRDFYDGSLRSKSQIERIEDILPK